MQTEADIDKIWADAERFMPTDKEVRERYGYIIDDLTSSLTRKFTKPVLTPWRLAGRYLVSFLENMAVLPEFPTAIQPALAMGSVYARGVSDQNNQQTAPPDEITAVAEGQNCRGQLTLASLPSGKLRFSLALLDNNYQSITPFYLTLYDADDNLIRDRQRCDDWQLTSDDLEKGAYHFLLEDEDGVRRVQMTSWVEEGS
jgi:hypothetical protein